MCRRNSCDKERFLYARRVLESDLAPTMVGPKHRCLTSVYVWMEERCLKLEGMLESRRGV